MTSGRVARVAWVMVAGMLLAGCAASWAMQAFAQMDLVVRKHFTVKNMIVWVKNNVTRGDLKGNYGYRHELVLFAHKGRRYLNGRRDARDPVRAIP